MSLRLDGNNSLSYMGVAATQPPQQLIMKRRPTTNDLQGIEIGTFWTIPHQNVGPSEEVWMLMSKAANVATWTLMNSSIPTTFPDHEILIGTGTATINTVPAGTLGECLISGGAGADAAFGSLSVPFGGTGNSTYVAYAPVCGGVTATAPLQSVATVGAAGEVLTSSGAGFIPTWQPVASAFYAITSIDDTDSPYTVLSSDMYIEVDSTSGPVIVKLPDTISVGKVFYIKDSAGTSAANNITVTTVTGAVLIDGATSYVISSNYQATSIIFNGSFYAIF